MIIYLDANKNREDSPNEEIFIVNHAEDAIDTVKLMQYLQQFRPERKVLKMIDMDNSETSLSFLAIMEARHWDYPLNFHAEPTRAMQLILDRNHWQYTVQEQVMF